MARCGCASATCACSLADGVNTTVEGDGSQATPYRVNVSCEAIQDCVGAAITAGCGLFYDDAANSISVRLSAQGGNTLQCLPDGLFSTPGAIAIGCGLTTDGGGNVVVNTVGAFGDLTRRNCSDTGDAAGTTALDPACELEGMPIYCDINGELRTKPEKFTEVANATINEAYAPNINALPFTTTPIQIGADNPSDCYCLCGFVTFAFIPAINGAPGTVIRLDHEVDLGDGIFGAITGFTMDNRGKSATSSATSRPFLGLPLCLDPGETKIIRHRVRVTRDAADNGGAIVISGMAREIRFVGSNL